MKAAFPLPDTVLTSMKATLVRDVVRHLTDALAVSHGIDAQAMAKCLMDAETTGGSSIGDGVAVISARVPASVTPRRLCAFAQLDKPVFFRGVEQHPCDLVFMMVSPDNEAQAHLRDLSCIIRTLRDQDFTNRLRDAKQGDRIAGLFRARDMALTQAA